jgi:hypothetical protein
VIADTSSDLAVEPSAEKILVSASENVKQTRLRAAARTCWTLAGSCETLRFGKGSLKRLQHEKQRPTRFCSSTYSVENWT